ncbi:MAG: hypothetical protein FD156_1782 [Nitrospirae bacterium]|nr:MAG: hypothetical protein FD156_1782 [Nitrospirota bacterium]
MEKNLEYYKKLSYDVVLKKKGDCFVLFIPDLCCMGEDASLGKAYEKLELEKEKYFQEMIASGSQLYIREPEAIKLKRSNLVNNLLPFLIKLLIIGLIGVVGMQVAVTRIKSAEHKISQKALGAVKDLNNKFKSMSPERKEEIRMELRETVQNVKPFVDEIKVLLEDEHKRKP